jgi:hypothetical protein
MEEQFFDRSISRVTEGLSRYSTVLGVLSEQTFNLTDQVL